MMTYCLRDIDLRTICSSIPLFAQPVACPILSKGKLRVAHMTEGMNDLGTAPGNVQWSYYHSKRSNVLVGAEGYI